MTNLPQVLPNHSFNPVDVLLVDMPEGDYLKASLEHHRCMNAAGWNPKLVHLRGNEYISNTCSYKLSNDTYKPWRISLIRSYTKIEFEDHPFLDVIKGVKGMPKVVKSLYTKEVRLKYYRASEAWDELRHMDRANEAYGRFLTSQR